MKLQDDCGVWIDDQKAITDKFISDFTQCFKSAYTTTRTIPNLGLPKLITDFDKTELTKLPNLEEAKDALFSIDSNKIPRPDGFGVGFLRTIGILSKRIFLPTFLNFL